MTLTLDDLASMSGVSRATISRVLNGGSVAPRTRARVEAVLAETGYSPNRAARSLASGRSGVVGVVMHLEPSRLFVDPYFSGLLQGMSDVLAEQATGMMLWLGNRSKQETLTDIQRMGLVDGLIVTAHWLDDPLVDGLLASPIPTVLIGHRREDHTASYVDVDNVEAARSVVQHLVDTGRTRIAHITGIPGSVAGEDRLVGYRLGMADAGLPTEGLVVTGDFNAPSGAAAVPRLLDRGVDAIFCANDATASGALEALQAAGATVPDDVALVGFDDLDFATRLDPPLTTIRQQVPTQGAEAARVLLNLLDTPDSGPRRVLLPTELVIRQSTIGASDR